VVCVLVRHIIQLNRCTAKELGESGNFCRCDLSGEVSLDLSGEVSVYYDVDDVVDTSFRRII
jgi:hypothetical protein